MPEIEELGSAAIREAFTVSHCASPASMGLGLDADGMVRAVRDRLELVLQENGGHPEQPNRTRPIVGRRNLDPAGKLAAADVFKVAQRRDGRSALRAFDALCRHGGCRLPLRKTPDGRRLRLGRGFPRGLKQGGPIIVQARLDRRFLRFRRKRCGLIGAADRPLRDIQLAGSLAVTASVSSPARNCGKLPQFIGLGLTFLLRRDRTVRFLR